MKYKLSTLNFQLSTFLIVAFFASPLKAQVTIGDQTPPHSFSILELHTTNVKGGLRLPQLTTGQRSALTVSNTDGAGLVIYNTTINCVEYWDAGQWVSLCNGSADITFTNTSGTTVDPTATTFPAGGSTSDTYIPQNNPACTGVNPPYVTTVATGASYTHIATANPSTGAFTIHMDPNPSADSRYAVITVTDECRNQSQSFLFVQDGSVVPVQPGNIQGTSTLICPSGATQTYSITPVSGAVSYEWTLPAGWTGSSTTTSITVTPGYPPGTIATDGTTASGIIMVKAVNSAGKSVESSLIVTTCTGCCAYTSATAWSIFMCHNLGAEYTEDPFTPSMAINGDYYQWGNKASSVTHNPITNNDIVNGTWSAPTASEIWGSNATNQTAKDPNNDPCPDGFRIPSSDEWTGVISNNTVSAKGSSWSNSATTWSGKMFGNALFLPAAGERSNSSASTLSNRGADGYYWSNQASGTSNAFYATFTQTAQTGATTNMARGFGLSVRCIKITTP